MSTSGGSAGGGTLTTLTGQLASAVTTPSSPQFIMDTAILTVGTWLVTWVVTISAGATATQGNIYNTPDTATATLGGPDSVTWQSNTSNTWYSSYTWTSQWTVTAAGTIKLMIQPIAINLVQVQPTTYYGRHGTGYVAVKVA